MPPQSEGRRVAAAKGSARKRRQHTRAKASPSHVEVTQIPDDDRQGGSAFEDDCWLSVLRFLGPVHLTRYAILCSAARRHTDHDMLWPVVLPDVSSADEADVESRVVVYKGLKTAFLANCRLQCISCRAPTNYFFPLLGVRLCPTCEANAQTPHGGRFELCSKSDAKQVFLLDARDLDTLPSIQRSSPWATKCGELRLFLRQAVEDLAVKKYGSADALQIERYRLREETKRAAETPSVIHSEYEVRLSRKSVAPQPPLGTLPVAESSSGAEGDGSAQKEKQIEHCQWSSDVDHGSSVIESSEGVPVSASLGESSDGGGHTSETWKSGSESVHGIDANSSVRSNEHPDKPEKQQDVFAQAHKLRRRVEQQLRAEEDRARARNIATRPLKTEKTVTPEPLGLHIETSAPFVVKHVEPNSLADRKHGVQIGDKLLSVDGKSCTAYVGGWAAIKVALSQRPVRLSFQRTFHQFQKGALAPKRGSAAARLYRRSRGCSSTSLASDEGVLEEERGSPTSCSQSRVAPRSQGLAAWAQNRPWLEVDYLAMGVSGLEVLD